MKKTLILVFFAVFLASIAGKADAGNTNSMDIESSSNQYLSLSNGSQTGLAISGSMTIELWANTEGLTGEDFLVSRFNPNGDISYALTVIDSGWLAFMIKGGGSGNVIQKIVPFSMTPSTWCHLAVSYDAPAGSASFYVNGLMAGSVQTGYPGSINVGSADFTINSYAGGGGYFDGKVDDVRIWNVARTAAEISANYQTELTGSEANLKGYWKFNGNTSDSTANGNNLTNNGGAIFSTDVPFSGTTTTTPPPPTVLICSIGNPVDVNSVSDINGNNFPETVTLGYNSSNIPTVCFADVSTSAFIKELQFFAAGWILKDMFLAPDMSSPADGIPDISVMATNGNLNKIQIKDAVSGALIKEITLP